MMGALLEPRSPWELVTFLVFWFAVGSLAAQFFIRGGQR